MTKSATDVMQEIIFAAVVDSLDALKGASKGVPNTLLRDIGAIHTNSTFADLPKELQATITASVRGAFNRLLKEGYSVAPRDAAPPPRPPAGGQPPRPPRGGPRGAPPGGNRRRPEGGRPASEGNRKPNPRRPK
jgi:hypothetical protein